MSELAFDMPSAAAEFPVRGAWLVRHLAGAFALTDIRAAGIVGNLGFESDGFTKLQEEHPLIPGSKGGLGFAQWTGQRRTIYERWCDSKTLDPLSDEANVRFLETELRGAYAYVLSALRKELTLERCVFVFGRLYESPFGTTTTHLPGFDERLTYARRALAGLAEFPAGAALRYLRDGMVGEDVRELQQALSDKGYRVDVDGNFGPRTDRGVMDFQRDHQLTVDGLAGPETFAVLGLGRP